MNNRRPSNSGASGKANDNEAQKRNFKSKKKAEPKNPKLKAILAQTNNNKKGKNKNEPRPSVENSSKSKERTQSFMTNLASSQDVSTPKAAPMLKKMGTIKYQDAALQGKRDPGL